MKFKSKLEEGIFLKRYKRFFADILWRGQIVTAHVPNTGSMKSCNMPESPCLFSVSDNPERKLKYTLEMVKASTGAWVGVNTSTPNQIVKEALSAGLLPHWQGFDVIKPEYKISAETRFDFALMHKSDDGKKKHFIEVKNVTLAEGDVAQFPDAVTLRGQKHLRELIGLMAQGHSAELVFTVQRNDVKSFAPAMEIDPDYGELLHEAIAAGLRVTPLVVKLSSTEVELTTELLPIR